MGVAKAGSQVTFIALETCSWIGTTYTTANCFIALSNKSLTDTPSSKSSRFKSAGC